ncbi:MAG TPA: TlpA family protein disulfide reductase [Thiothrix sp.]|nr:TlpA family protein disulfide reductase [Thiothrix sp.]
MTRNMKTTLASLFLFGSLSAGAFASTMTTINGKSVQLSDYVGNGKWTIVEAWHSKCAICMKTMPEMVKAQKTFSDATLVGISLDENIAKTKQVVKRFDIDFPTLLIDIVDFDAYLNKVAKKRLSGVPTYLVFSPEGDLKALQTGGISLAELRNYIRTIKAKHIATLKQTLAEQIIVNQGEVELVNPEKK